MPAVRRASFPLLMLVGLVFVGGIGFDIYRIGKWVRFELSQIPIFVMDDSYVDTVQCA